MKVLEVKDVSKSFYSTHALTRVNFDLEKGEVLALAGENGLSADVVFLSGGSSIGVRDLTLEALQSLGDTEILCHGVALSPGKPLILARCGQTLVWGLPGQVASAQVVMHVLGVPFLRHLAGHSLMAQFFGQGNFG